MRPEAVDPDQLQALCRGWLDRLHGHGPNFEWAYSFVQPRLLVEEFLAGPGGGIPADYKLFVFSGRCHWAQVDSGRFAVSPRTTSTCIGTCCRSPATCPATTGRRRVRTGCRR